MDYTDGTKVSSDETTRFVPIIDSILVSCDLNTISEKRIRKGLQAVIEHDLTPQKVTTNPFIYIMPN